MWCVGETSAFYPLAVTRAPDAQQAQTCAVGGSPWPRTKGVRHQFVQGASTNNEKKQTSPTFVTDRSLPPTCCAYVMLAVMATAVAAALSKSISLVAATIGNLLMLWSCVFHPRIPKLAV